MNNVELSIVKLGGAAITDKSLPKTILIEKIKLAFSELRSINNDLIIVHGAGSFGHIFAKEYSLADGITDKVSIDKQIKGISKTKTALQELNVEIHKIALESGFHPFALPISASLITNGSNKVSSTFLEPVDQALKLGLMPIIYGDICFDKKSKFRVVSGDWIIQILCQFFKSKSIHVIFGTNVDGIYDKDPKLEDANLITQLSKAQLEEMIKLVGSSPEIDVTGGMKGKLKQIQRISQFANRIDIVNITIPNRLSTLLKKGKTIGTHIYTQA